jgi:di/tricarboxylate transporter
MHGLPASTKIVGPARMHFVSHYLFASLTMHPTAMLTGPLSPGLAMSGVPFETLAIMLGLTQGIMGVLTPCATDPAPVDTNSGYITSAEFWRLGTIFVLLFLAAPVFLRPPVVLWVR